MCTLFVKLLKSYTMAADENFKLDDILAEVEKVEIKSFLCSAKKRNWPSR